MLDALSRFLNKHNPFGETSGAFSPLMTSADTTTAGASMSAPEPRVFIYRPKRSFSWKCYLAALSDTITYINQLIQRIVKDMLGKKSLYRDPLAHVLCCFYYNIFLGILAAIIAIPFFLVSNDAFCSLVNSQLGASPSRANSIRAIGAVSKISIKLISTFASFWDFIPDKVVHKFLKIFIPFLIFAVAPTIIGELVFLLQKQGKEYEALIRKLTFNYNPVFCFYVCLFYSITSCSVTMISLNGLGYHNHWSDAPWFQNFLHYLPMNLINLCANGLNAVSYFLFNSKRLKLPFAPKSPALIKTSAFIRASINATSEDAFLTTVFSWVLSLFGKSIVTQSPGYIIVFAISVAILSYFTLDPNICRFSGGLSDKDKSRFIEERKVGVTEATALCSQGWFAPELTGADKSQVHGDSPRLGYGLL